MKKRMHTAVKRQVAGLIERGMAREGITRAELGRRIGSSVAQVNRVLDPGHTRVRLVTLVKAARAVKQNLRIGLAPRSTFGRTFRPALRAGPRSPRRFP
jgi:antitoxin HicB